MELFNKYNNLKFVVAEYIINIMATEKRSLTITELDVLVKQKLGEYGVDTGDFALINEFHEILQNQKQYGKQLMNEGKSDLIEYDRETKTYSLVKNTVLPFVLSESELEFLKLTLGDEEARCFISKELAEKLDKALEPIDVSYISENFITRLAQKNHIDAEHTRAVLQTVMTAIHSGRKIRYSYKTKKSTVSAVEAPYKILYSLRDRQLRLISRIEDEDRLILQNISQLEEVSIADEFGSAGSMDADGFFAKRSRSVVLRVTEEEEKTRKTVERCQHLFGSLNRETQYIPEDSEYRISIDYYNFDKEKLIRDILSLGSAVVVVSPEIIRNEVIEMIKKAYNAMCKNDNQSHTV